MKLRRFFLLDQRDDTTANTNHSTFRSSDCSIKSLFLIKKIDCSALVREGLGTYRIPESAQCCQKYLYFWSIHIVPF